MMNLNSINDCFLKLQSYPKNFNVGHINAQSIPRHFDEILHMLSGSTLDCLCISESFLKSHLTNKMFEIPNFKLLRADRVSTRGRGVVRRGGGVAVYLNVSIPHKILFKSGSNDQVEYMFIEIRLEYIKIVLGVIYKAPNVCYRELSFLNDILDEISVSYDNIFICGDMNVNFFNENADKKFLTDIFSPFNLTSVGSSATHWPPNHPPTQIDLFMTNNPNKVKYFEGAAVPGISYHLCLVASLSVVPPKSKPKVYEFRNFKNIDLTALLRETSEISWNEFYSSSNLDDMVSMFNRVIISLFDKYCPLKKIKLKSPPKPWIVPELLECMAKRDLAFRYASRFGNSPNKEFFLKNFRDSRLACSNLNSNLKKTYLIGQLSGHVTPKKFWATAENFGIKSGNDSLITGFDPDALNEHFIASTNPATVDASSSSAPSMSSLPSHLAHSRFEFQSVSEVDVFHGMRGITSNAVGFDNLSMRFLKLIQHLIIPQMTHMINFSFETSCFSSFWKKSLITPIPKTTDVRSLNDLRPISILPCISKIVERIAHDQLTSYLERNNLLNDYQSGFRRGHSTMTALLKVTDDIRKSINDGMVTILVLLDFTKAFGSMDHDLLIDKLIHHYGLSDSSVAWFRSYLAGRSQSVRFEGRSSGWRDISSGVPEGSILGPLLFSLFINNISDGLLFSKYHIYADDCQVYHSFPVSKMETGLAELNHDLSILNNWSRLNGLRLNAAKTQVLVCGKPRDVRPLKDALLDQTIGLFLGCDRLRPTNVVKNLGVFMDESLTGIHHVNHILKQVYLRLRQLYYFNHILPIDVKKRLVQSLVFPFFDYCDLIFYELGAALEAKLNVAHNNCIRFIFGLKRHEIITPYRVRLGFLLPKLRRQMRMSVFLYKLFGSGVPCYLRNIFVFLNSGHDTRYRLCNTRIPICHSKYFKASFQLAASKLWNCLDPPLRRSDSLLIFKKDILRILMPS
jgi:hypothetical protein